MGAVFCEAGYGVVASVVWEDQRFRLRGERGEGREMEDLHARIPTCDYEYVALEIRESVGMESHVQNEYLSRFVKV